jgi:hypothetical protein
VTHLIRVPLELFLDSTHEGWFYIAQGSFDICKKKRNSIKQAKFLPVQGLLERVSREGRYCSRTVPSKLKMWQDKQFHQEASLTKRSSCKIYETEYLNTPDTSSM